MTGNYLMKSDGTTSENLGTNGINILSFSNKTKLDKKFLKLFVNFHWDHYQGEPRYVPLLDYEYLGFKLIGMKGIFKPDNIFFKHADMRFFFSNKKWQHRGSLQCVCESQPQQALER